MFINFSNHPSTLWDEKQLRAAKEYGSVVDLPFPQVPPTLTREEVLSLAAECAEKIIKERPTAVMCQGEWSLCFAVTNALLKRGITVLCACTDRKSYEIQADGKTEKSTVFEFKNFRKYSYIEELSK